MQLYVVTSDSEPLPPPPVTSRAHYMPGLCNTCVLEARVRLAEVYRYSTDLAMQGPLAQLSPSAQMHP